MLLIRIFSYYFFCFVLFVVEKKTVKFRTSLSASEVLTVIETHSKRHFGDDGVGVVMKIELIETDAATKSKSFRTINSNDRFRLPLVKETADARSYSFSTFLILKNFSLFYYFIYF